MQGEGTCSRCTSSRPTLVHQSTLQPIKFLESTSVRVNASFGAMRPDEVTSCDLHNLKQGNSTLQEYLERIIKLRAWTPEVA